MMDVLASDFEPFLEESRDRGRNALFETIETFHTDKRKKTETSIETAIGATRAQVKAELDSWKDWAAEQGTRATTIKKHLASTPRWPDVPAMEGETVSEDQQRLYQFTHNVWFMAEYSYRSGTFDDEGEQTEESGRSQLVEVARRAAGKVIGTGHQLNLSHESLQSRLTEISRLSAPGEDEQARLEGQIKLDIGKNARAELLGIHTEDETTSLSPKVKDYYSTKEKYTLHGLASDIYEDNAKGVSKTVKEVPSALNAYSATVLDDAINRGALRLPEFTAPKAETKKDLLLKPSVANEISESCRAAADTCRVDAEQTLVTEIAARYRDRNAETIENLSDPELTKELERASQHILATEASEWRSISEEKIAELKKVHDEAEARARAQFIQENPDMTPPAIKAFEDQQTIADHEERKKIIEENLKQVVPEILKKITDEEQAQFEKFDANARAGLKSLGVVLGDDQYLENARKQIDGALKETNKRIAESIDGFTKDTRTNLEDHYRDLGEKILTLMVLRIWRAHLTKGAYSVHQWLRRELFRQRDLNGLTLPLLGGSRQRLRVLGEWVALGAACRVISADGETAYYPGDLLEQLDENSLKNMP